eukprot:scaffold800_cov159-Pinguiococcus_pyrenoidosus.AAC.5
MIAVAHASGVLPSPKRLSYRLCKVALRELDAFSDSLTLLVGAGVLSPEDPDITMSGRRQCIVRRCSYEPLNNNGEQDERPQIRRGLHTHRRRQNCRDISDERGDCTPCRLGGKVLKVWIGGGGEGVESFGLGGGREVKGRRSLFHRTLPPCNERLHHMANPLLRPW